MTNNSTYDDDLETLGKALLTDCRVAADVYALEPTCCVSWPKAKLRKFLRDRPELRAAFQSILGAKLSTLLEESWARQPSVSANASPE